MLFLILLKIINLCPNWVSFSDFSSKFLSLNVHIYSLYSDFLVGDYQTQSFYRRDLLWTTANPAEHRTCMLCVLTGFYNQRLQYHINRTHKMLTLRPYIWPVCWRNLENQYELVTEERKFWEYKSVKNHLHVS